MLIALDCTALGALPVMIFGMTDLALASSFAIGLPAFVLLLLVLVRAKAERWEG